MADLDDKKVVNIGWLKEQGYVIKEAYTDNTWCPTYNNITAGTIGDNIGVSATCYGTGLEYVVTQLVCAKDVYPSGECTCPLEYGTATVTQTDSGLSVIPASGGSYTFSSNEVPYSAFTSTPTPEGCSPCVYSSSAYTSFTTANITIPPNTTTEPISIEGTNNHIHYVINQEAAGSCTCDNLTLSTSELSWSYAEITGSTSKTVTLTTNSCISDISVSSSDASICTASVNDNTVTISPNNNIGETYVTVSYKSNGSACSKTIACTFNEKECNCGNISVSTSYLEWTFANVTAHTSSSVTISTPSCINSTPTVTVKDTSLCTASFSNGTLTVTPKGTFGETMVEVNYVYGISGSCSITILCKFMNCNSSIDDIDIISDEVIGDGKVSLNVGTGFKFILKYNDGTPDYTYSCDGSNLVTKSNVQSNGHYNNISHITFGSCAIEIDTKNPNELTGTSHPPVFSGNTSLESVTFGKNISWIGYESFCGCNKLKSVKIPSEAYVSHGAFKRCSSLTSVTFDGDNINGFGVAVFEYCTSLETITLPKTTTQGYLAAGTFEGCTKLKEVKFLSGGNYHSIGASAFSGCTKLSGITIPNTVKKISDHAFVGCTSLTSVNLSNTLENIALAAFEDCTSLTSVTLPSTVKWIETGGFSNCSNLKSVTFYATTPPEIGASFENCHPDLVIYVPSGSVNAYKTTGNWWPRYANRIQAIP